ncbi:hypothetical protein HanRHA438_Chr05g0206041 [Helianthus annuus]|nr:hypothetical protein HanRHA438_Chr05g0206041 [Helianthus annuus]
MFWVKSKKKKKKTNSFGLKVIYEILLGEKLKKSNFFWKTPKANVTTTICITIFL